MLIQELLEAASPGDSIMWIQSQAEKIGKNCGVTFKDADGAQARQAIRQALQAGLKDGKSGKAAHGEALKDKVSAIIKKAKADPDDADGKQLVAAVSLAYVEGAIAGEQLSEDVITEADDAVGQAKKIRDRLYRVEDTLDNLIPFLQLNMGGELKSKHKEAYNAVKAVFDHLNDTYSKFEAAQKALQKISP